MSFTDAQIKKTAHGKMKNHNICEAAGARL